MATLLTGILFALIVAALLWTSVGWVLMALITPRQLIERYFKKPHFNTGELIIYQTFPGLLMRSLVFMGACINRRYWTGRQMPDYLEHVPRWFYLASATFLYVLFLLAGSIIGLMGGLIVHAKWLAI